MNERIRKYMQEELTPTERLNLLHEIEKDESLRKEFIHIQNMKAVLNLSPETTNRETGRIAYSHFRKKLKRNNIHRIITRSLQYAAMLALVVFSTYWITSTYLLKTPPLIAETNKLFVPAGQRAQITLQDGTVVWLNAQSTLIYPSHFESSERRVMVSGEAYFEVTKDVHKPFVVDAQGTEIKVLGTQFNVYCYPDAGFIQTSLIEGAIEVSSPEQLFHRVLLKPNEQVTVQDGKAIVERIEYADSFSWREGIYSFNDERLEDIVRKLELYYDVRIILNHPDLKDIRYTCKFRQRDGIDEILQIFNRLQKFKIVKDKEQNIITLS